MGTFSQKESKIAANNNNGVFSFAMKYTRIVHHLFDEKRKGIHIYLLYISKLQCFLKASVYIEVS